MTEYTHSYTNFQMFVLVYHRFMVIIRQNCYLKEHFFFKIKGIATPIWTRGQHGIDACSSPVRMCRNAYEKLAPDL